MAKTYDEAFRQLKDTPLKSQEFVVPQAFVDAKSSAKKYLPTVKHGEQKVAAKP